MKNLRLILIVLCSIIYQESTLAIEISKYRFHVMPETSYYGGIHSIAKDSIGRIWYSGHDALFIYNGNSFYQMNEFVTVKSPKSYWSYGQLLTDKSKRLYVATNQGLLHFNYETLGFDFVQTGNVSSIALDDDGFVWLIKDGKLEFFLFDQLPVINSFILPPSISPSQIVCANGNIYIASSGQVYKINKETRKYSLFADLGNENNAMRDVIEYNGFVYILTHMNGLYVLDHSGNVKKHYNIHFESGKSPVAKKMHLDSSNIIWTATQLGLFLLDPSTGQTDLLQSNLNNIYSLPNNSVWSIYPDPDGGIWIGTYGGKLAYTTLFDNNVSYTEAIPGGLNHSIVSCFEEDKNGNIWIGTEGGGLNFWDRKNGKFKYYTQYSKNSINSNMIKKLRFDKNKDILQISAFNGGIGQYNANTGHFTDMQMYYPDTQQQLNIYDYAMEGDSGIWATDPDVALFYKNKKSGKVEIASIYDLDSKEIKMQIETLFRGNGNDLWLVTHQGLYMIDVRTRKIVKRYYIEDAPYSVNNLCSYCLTSDSDIWLGTHEGGINRLSKDGSYVNFGSKDGLAGKTVFGILEDSGSKDIWFSTNDGLYYYDHKDEKIVKAKINTPNLCGAFYIRSCYKTSKGEMLFGGTSGFIMFTPDKIKYNNQKSEVFFTDFLINNNRVIPALEDSPLKKDISTFSYTEANNDKIILSHKQSNIEIRFSSNSYLQADKNQYKYRMLGLSDNWYTLTQGQKSVQFFNLPAGKYVFEIKAANNDGLWSDKVSTLYFDIKPSPFLSVWAYIIYTMLLLSLAYLIWRYFTNKKMYKHELEMEQIKEQNMRKLTQARINFFTNISHDLKTPLTLVVDPLKRLKELLPDNQSSRAYIHLIEKNVTRIQRMISQLLQFREIESQKITLNLQPGDLIQYISNIFSLFELYANKKGIEPNMSSYVDNLYTNFDHDVIEKIFTNLFSNAIKYTPDNGYIGVKIYKATPDETAGLEPIEKQSPDVEYVSVTITNTGAEIPEDKKELIFKSFNRLSTQRPAFEESTGLGLAIVSELVDSLKGKIALTSETNKVSFTITLPFSPNTQSVENDVSYEYTISEINNILEDSENVNLNNKQSRKAHNIVVIEDDSNLRVYMEQRLSEHYNVYTAINGVEGIAKAEKIYPQIVITDLMMPEADGFDVCRNLRSNFKTSHIPIIVLSALGENTEYKIKALESGANVFIDKPFDMEYLLKQVNNLIKNQIELKELYSKKYIADPSKITITSMDEELLKKAMRFIEHNISNPDYDVEAFVSDMSIGRTLLYQKINDIVGMSIKEFILDIRLKRSAQLLKESDFTISEIADKTGFNNAKYFSICFKKHFESTPSEFKKKL